jgi:hypothetical protein
MAMAHREFTKKQGIAIVAGVVIAVSGALWGGYTLAHNQSAAAAHPVEIAPVQEQVTAGGREEPAQATPAPHSDAEARRQEALQNLKFTATHQK